ncbi:MAG: tRNA lysidine(34) synthetase TilS [Fluviicola sp.]|nr:tRNA lysidine(34) synthetase TilS [Fluviicola sp.]
MVKDLLKESEFAGLDLLIGVSGGLDSIVLVHACLAHDLRPTLLHINYQLRGDESEADEQFVRQLAEKHCLKLQVVRCPNEMTVGKGINLQQAARDFRRTFFDEWIAQSPNHKVVLAHHADDQVETFFLQFARGAGLKGLGGMYENRDGYLRPFLHFSKQTLAEIAVSEKITWREDASNQSLKYNRNKWRNVFIPIMEQENPTIKESVLLLQAVFRENYQTLQATFRASHQAIFDQGQVLIEQWNAFTTDEKHVLCNELAWPSWAVVRMNELVYQQKSASFLVGETTVFKTKSAIVWKKNEVISSLKTLVLTIVDTLPEHFDKVSVYLDERKVVGQLVLRKVRETDRIAPIGMKGTQLLTKVLKDTGFSLQERADFYVVADEQEVIWIPNIKVSRNKLAQANTVNCLQLSLK